MLVNLLALALGLFVNLCLGDENIRPFPAAAINTSGDVLLVPLMRLALSSLHLLLQLLVNRIELQQ